MSHRFRNASGFELGEASQPKVSAITSIRVLCGASKHTRGWEEGSLIGEFGLWVCLLIRELFIGGISVNPVISHIYVTTWAVWTEPRLLKIPVRTRKEGVWYRDSYFRKRSDVRQELQSKQAIGRCRATAGRNREA
jgi:hypothetical protein